MLTYAKFLANCSIALTLLAKKKNNNTILGLLNCYLIIFGIFHRFR